jgi:hypothetical protein
LTDLLSGGATLDDAWFYERWCYTGEIPSVAECERFIASVLPGVSSHSPDVDLFVFVCALKAKQFPFAVARFRAVLADTHLNKSVEVLLCAKACACPVSFFYTATDDMLAGMFARMNDST